MHRHMYTAHALPRAHQPALVEYVALAGDAALSNQGPAARRPAALKVPQRGPDLRIGHLPQRPSGRHALQHYRNLRAILLQVSLYHQGEKTRCLQHTLQRHHVTDNIGRAG